MEYTLILFSIHPEELPEIQRGLGNIPVTYFDGTGYSSYSKVVNAAIASAKTETVILMSDKARPSAAHVHKTLELLEQGYGFVGLHEFRFFGFKKQLFREMGLFDEGYITGGYEDDDIKNRLIERDIAFYLTNECPAVVRQTHWNYEGSRPYFVSKWNYQFYPQTDKVQYITRLTPEPTYSTYDLGKSVPTRFLSHKTNSVGCTDKVFQLMDAKILDTSTDITTIVISENIGDFYKAKSLIGNADNLGFFNCSNYDSFSKVVNTCVSSAPSDRVILIFGSVLPTPGAISAIKYELAKGIGVSASCEFRLFGINRQVCKHVGAFDENFQSCEYNTRDYLLRCIMANISITLTHATVPRSVSLSKVEQPSYSDHTRWEAKWLFTANGNIMKLLPEKSHSYNFSTKNNIPILDCVRHGFTNSGTYSYYFNALPK
jgi:hypothetical protein